jgi:hypothetical protein
MNGASENRMEELAREKMAGKSYTSMREELLATGMSEEEVRVLIRQVDERVLSETVKQGVPDRAQQWYRFGLILAVLGLILSIAYNAGIILETRPALLVYSPFFAGILVMVYGRILQRKKASPGDEGTGAIRRRRPFK